MISPKARCSPCHETTEYDAEDEALVATDSSQFCAGALIVLEHEGPGNQATRMAERLGLYDAERLDMDAPVHRSLAAFVSHHDDLGEGADDEPDTACCVADAGCEAPAGYLVNGMVVPAEPEGEVHECASCGQTVCDSCSNEDGICRNCEEESDGLRG